MWSRRQNYNVIVPDVVVALVELLGQRDIVSCRDTKATNVDTKVSATFME